MASGMALKQGDPAQTSTYEHAKKHLQVVEALMKLEKFRQTKAYAMGILKMYKGGGTTHKKQKRRGQTS